MDKRRSSMIDTRTKFPIFLLQFTITKKKVELHGTNKNAVI
jgi:hypothetical protein